MSGAAADEPVRAPAPELLAVLVCPLSRTRLRWQPETSELVADEAGLAYPVRDGIPVMLVDEARRL